MNTQRFFEAMILKLSLEQKNLEDILENIINSDLNLNEKTIKFQKILNEMVLLESSILKFNEMMTNYNNNKKEN